MKEEDELIVDFTIELQDDWNGPGTGTGNGTGNGTRKLDSEPESGPEEEIKRTTSNFAFRLGLLT